MNVIRHVIQLVTKLALVLVVTDAKPHAQAGVRVLAQVLPIPFITVRHVITHVQQHVRLDVMNHVKMAARQDAIRHAKIIAHQVVREVVKAVAQVIVKTVAQVHVKVAAAVVVAEIVI